MNNELIDGYGRVQERLGLRKSTIQTRRWLLAAIGRNHDLLIVMPHDIEEWIDRRDVSLRTRKTYLCLLAPFFAWLVKTGRRADNPVADIDRPRLARMLPRPIATADLRYAMGVAPARMRAWLCLAAFQGFRCYEIAGLRREGVVDASEPGVVIVEDGKGGQQRIVPLHAQTWAALAAVGLPRTGHVFRLNGAPYDPSQVSRQISQFFAALDMEWTAHNLRHWFGTEVFRGCRDLRVTQEMMGHSSPNTTALYTAWSPEVADGVVRGLSLGDEPDPPMVA